MRVRHFSFTALFLSLAITAGSSLQAQRKVTLKQQVAPSESISFDIYLPQQHRDEVDTLLAGLHDSTSSSYRQWLTPAQFQARFGTPVASVQAIQKELSNYGLSSTLSSPHILHVSGSAAQVQQALGTALSHGTMASGKAVVVATSPLNLPTSLQSVGAVVASFSGTIHMHGNAKRQAAPANRYSTAGPYWFDDLKEAYTWPSYATYAGKGSTIAVLMSGGYSQADMNLYFSHEKLATPKISEVDVLGGNPYNPGDDGSLEAELDIQQSGGMAPKANIVLYSVPDLSDESIIAGLAQIIADNKADIVTMSFGGPELGYAPEYNDGVDYSSILLAEDDLMAEGNALGMTFISSSGDAGALSIPAPACFFTDNVPCGKFVASAEFPASSPHVTGVGGTNLETTYNATNLNSAYISEEAFADPLTADIFFGTAATGGYWGSGGGDSILFKKPLYQKLVDTGNSRVRTVPDLALHMGGCPADAVCNSDDSSDVEGFAGGFYLVIGTSASAPAFAGLTALNVERFGTRLGNENFYIYSLAALQDLGVAGKVFHTGIPGFNGLYTSGNKGYNRVLGNGTLYGKDFILAPLVPSAGIPQTTTNP